MNERKIKLLGRRHMTSDEDVQRITHNIETIVPREDLEQLCENTIDAIKQVTRGHKTAFAWSAGKDSLVLAHLLERAHVTRTGVLGITVGLEYPAMDTWYRDNTPDDITINRAPYDMEWLASNTDYIFTLSPPFPQALTGFWAEKVWLHPQKKYCEQREKDMLILGRRRADGNYCGPGESGIYTTKGVIRYLPIMHWSQEEVLAYLHYYHIQLPPVYQWVNGFKVGTHPWPARQAIITMQDGWAQVYSCDPTIVYDAATFCDSAKEYLDNPTPIQTEYHVWAGRKLGKVV